MTDALLGTVSRNLLETGREFAVLVLKVAPFFLAGAAAGAALQTFLPKKWADRLFGGDGLRSLLAAVAAGAILPGCSCATMPMAAGLRGTANPRLGTVAAFIFVSPLLSPVTVALTWGMLGWRMTAARTAASLFGSVLLGLIINRFEGWFAGSRKNDELSASAEAESACVQERCGPDEPSCNQAPPEATGFWRSLRAVLRAVTPYFLLGMLIAAALSALLPEEAIPRFLGGSSGIWAYSLAALVGVPMYVCEGEEVPITYALISRGLGPGPSLTFLLGSVGTCIPTMLMARNVIGRRATVFYILYWFAFAIVSGVLFQTFLA